MIVSFLVLHLEQMKSLDLPGEAVQDRELANFLNPERERVRLPSRK